MRGMESPRRVLWCVFFVALGFRLGWLGLVAGAHDGASVVRLFPDSIRYDAIARCLLGEQWTYPADVEMLPSDPLYRDFRGALLYSAPGYPAFVFGLYWLFGPSAWAVLIVQAVLSAASCALIAGLAWQLFACRRIALMAGLMASVSLTSFTLAAALATETLFNTFFLASVVSGIEAFRRARQRLSVISAVCLAAAGIIKPVVMLWPFVIAAIWWVRARSDAAVRAAWPRVLMVVLTVGACWFVAARRAGATAGVFTIGEMGTSSMRWMWTARALSDVNPTRDVRGIQRDWRARQRPGLTFREAHDEDLRIVAETMRAHPWAMARAWFAAVAQNCLAPDDLHAAQVPQGAILWKFVDPVMRRAGVPFVLAAALISWIALVRSARKASRLKGAAWLLAAVFLYFSLLSGAAYWQGSRYLYPANAAVCIALAWGLCAAWSRRRARQASRLNDST